MEHCQNVKCRYITKLSCDELYTNHIGQQCIVIFILNSITKYNIIAMLMMEAEINSLVGILTHKKLFLYVIIGYCIHFMTDVMSRKRITELPGVLWTCACWYDMTGDTDGEMTWLETLMVRWHDWWHWCWDDMTGDTDGEMTWLVTLMVRWHDWWHWWWDDMTGDTDVEMTWLETLMVRWHDWWHWWWDDMTGDTDGEMTWLVTLMVRWHDWWHWWWCCLLICPGGKDIRIADLLRFFQFIVIHVYMTSVKLCSCDQSFGKLVSSHPRFLQCLYCGLPRYASFFTRILQEGSNSIVS